MLGSAGAAQAAPEAAVDSAIDSVINAVKATGDAVKVGLDAANTGVGRPAAAPFLLTLCCLPPYPTKFASRPGWAQLTMSAQRSPAAQRPAEPWKPCGPGR